MKRTSWISKLKAELAMHRSRRQLRTGLQRLQRSRSLLQQLLKETREQATRPETVLDPKLAKALGLPQRARLTDSRLKWMLELTEDLYLLLETTEEEMREKLLSMSKLS